MSPRAAVRIRSLGYENVHDYVGGKADWLASGELFEGTTADPSVVGSHVDRGVPTVDLTTDIAVVRELIDAHDVVIVATEEGVVLGRINAADLSGDLAPDIAAEIMRSGPTTVRADEPIDELHPRMEERHVSTIVVTRPDGVLIGVHRWGG